MPKVLVQQFHKLDDKFAKVGEARELELTEDELAQLEKSDEVVYLGTLDGYFALAGEHE